MSPGPMIRASGRRAMSSWLVGLLLAFATADRSRDRVRQSFRRQETCFAPARMAIRREASIDGPRSPLPVTCKSSLLSSSALSLWKRDKEDFGVQDNGEDSSKRALVLTRLRKMVSRIAMLGRKDGKEGLKERGNDTSVRLLRSRKWRPAAFALLSASTVARSVFGGGVPSGGLTALVQPAHASAANLPLVPKISTPQPHLDALERARQNKARGKDGDETQLRIDMARIAQEEGKEAAEAYQKSFREEQKRKAELYERKVERLKVELMREGLDPFNDPEFERRVTLFETGVDLNDYVTTRQYMALQRLRFEGPRKDRHLKTLAGRRYIFRCTVYQLQTKGVDPMEFFEENKPTTRKLWSYSDAEIDERVEIYKKQMMETIGQEEPIFEPLPPLEGTEEALTPEEKKAREKKAKEEAKQNAKAAAARLKEKEKAKKAREEALLKGKPAAATTAGVGATVAGAAAGAAGAAASGAAQGIVGSVTDVVPKTIPPPHERVIERRQISANTAGAEGAGVTTADSETSGTDSDDAATATSITPVVGSVVEEDGGLPIVPAAGVLAALSAGGYVYQTNRKNAAIEEEERKRNLNRIMGVDKGEATPTATIVDVKKDGETPVIPLPDTSVSKAQESDSDDDESDDSAAKETPKKRRKGGLASVFRKKSGNSRPTDLSTLVAEDAAAPELAKTLAKILTFGAPGRFPDVVALPGEMPLEEFDLEKAKAILVEERSKTTLEEKDAAELFASVVNCMIIDIIDLASSALKEKEDKVAVDALDVVMNFMDSAASLFDAVAEGVAITPVTYGGDLPKSKLEQMFGVYASARAMDLTGSGQERIDMLKVVFNISDKKAEGLIQRNLLKKMMKMMKDGKAPEGMEDMMAAMGGLGEGGGLPGMDGMDPENLKESVQAMKELMDSGSVSKEEIEMVKDQFKEMYGSDLSELIAAADNEDAQAALGEDGKELLDMFKQMMKE